MELLKVLLNFLSILWNWFWEHPLAGTIILLSLGQGGYYWRQSKKSKKIVPSILYAFGAMVFLVIIIGVLYLEARN